jgi:uncharacterized protein
MPKQLEVKRIIIFLAFAYGIAWAAGLAIYLSGGLAGAAAGGQSMLLIYTLLAVYMCAPALAHVLTRLLTKEGWHGTLLRPKFKHGWRYWLACWFGPGILTFIGMAVFFVIFPQYFDPNLGAVKMLLESATQQTGKTLPAMSPWVIIGIQSLQAFLIAPVVNGLLTFGEEFGWRSYLITKLMPLGWRRAMLVMGVIWGVWHWPLTVQGHNYGLEYPGVPWLGMLAMVWFTFALGTFLGWANLKAGSVWPAVIGHGAINGIAGIAVLFVQGDPNPVLGPSVAGVIGASGFALLAIILLIRPGRLALEGTEVNNDESRDTFNHS